MKKKKGNRGQQQRPQEAAGQVRPKKHLGQHFLRDENIARKIGDTLSLEGYDKVLEIGPGMGVLTKYLLQKPVDVYAMDLDTESVAYLRDEFTPEHQDLPGRKEIFRVLEEDFLRCDLASIFGNDPFAITGNYPYNISTQIVFKALEWRAQVPEFTGMFQKEVAQRICEKEGSKAYGILSVLTQAFYEAEYLFTVPPGVFNPPPKVDSGVLRLRRKANYELPCDERLFFRVVKMAFQQRRKTLRNSLKTLGLPDNLKEDAIFGRRPESLSVAEFIELVRRLEAEI